MADRNTSELVFGLVGAVGTNLTKVADELMEGLKKYGYKTRLIEISKEVIPLLKGAPRESAGEFDRVSALMDAGDRAREATEDNGILAVGAATLIYKERNEKDERPMPEHAHIVKSLKHPDEVDSLRKIYADGFYLIGVHCHDDLRKKYLTNAKQMSPDQAQSLMERDEHEEEDHGQQTRETFHMADFFVGLGDSDVQLRESIARFLRVLFGHPYTTPTFDEYAMFMAFCAALRSADLARQVGAVVAHEATHEIVATGSNDCPCFGGGLYWPEYDEAEKRYVDRANGRDYMRGVDSNRLELNRIIDEIVKELSESNDDAGKCKKKVLSESRIRDLTEFGRSVHAEMEALLCCARNGTTTRGATLFCTTFPCHNCARHIIASGIKRVVFVEPYPKSQAAALHDDAITLREEEKSTNRKRVLFQPFVGIGPRRFFDLFSMKLSTGYPLERKSKETGRVMEWKEREAIPRISMKTTTYVDVEKMLAEKFLKAREQINNDDAVQ